MPNYKTMYYALFNSLTEVMEILQKAQQEGERLFIEEDKSVKKEPSTSCKKEPE
ncbi:MAG: hypothetical protein AAGU32_11925 [Bacillota bacterium]